MTMNINPRVYVYVYDQLKSVSVTKYVLSVVPSLHFLSTVSLCPSEQICGVTTATDHYSAKSGNLYGMVTTKNRKVSQSVV